MDKKAILVIDLDGCEDLIVTPILPKKYCPTNGYIDTSLLEAEGFDYVLSYEGSFENCLLMPVESGVGCGVRIRNK